MASPSSSVSNESVTQPDDGCSMKLWLNVSSGSWWETKNTAENIKSLLAPKHNLQMKTGTLPVTLGKPDDQRVMHGIAEPMLASTVYTWCFMRTAGLPSPTATLEDRFNRRFSYCLINNNTCYISFQITNSYPSFPSTGRPQQQQQNNKASIKMHKGIKSPAKRPALLPSRQTQKTGERDADTSCENQM